MRWRRRPHGYAAAPARTNRNTDPYPGSGTVIQRGGVLVEANRSSTALMLLQTPVRNPEAGPAHEWVSRQIYHTIMWNDPYDDGALKGMLADSWQYNAASDEITFHVNPAAKWADGIPVTAQDFKANIDLWGNPPEGFTVDAGARTPAGAVESVVVVDELTVLVKLTRPSVSTLSAFANYDVLVKPAHRTFEENSTSPVGSTAFDLIDVDTDVKFTMVRNPNYWRTGFDGGLLPYVDGVESIIFTNGDRVFAGLLTGQIDIAHQEWGAAVTGKKDEVARRMPNAILQKRFASSAGWGMKNKAPFNDPNVFKAFFIATDRLAWIELSRDGEGVLDSMGVLAASAGNVWSIPTAEVMAAPGFRYLDRATGELVTDTFQLLDGLSTKYMRDPNDLLMAKDLLAQADFADPKDFPTLNLLGDNLYVESDTTVNAQTLRDGLGIDVILDIKDFTSASEQRANGTFDAVQFFIHTTGFDPSSTLRWYTTDIHFWDHGFQLPGMDDLYIRQDSEVDPAKRLELVFEMQRRILAGTVQTGIPIAGFHSSSGIFREWVINMPIPIVSLTTNYWWDEVWIEQTFAEQGGRR